MMDTMLIAQRVVARHLEALEGTPLPETDDPKVRFEALLAFNTILAKLMQRLKRDAGATTIVQNYKGTGSQAWRRQLWIHFKSGAVIDIWLNKDHVKLGGVVLRSPPESTKDLAQAIIPYGNLNPEKVYAQTAKILKGWANP
jgi:hypothetical protein